MEKMIRGWVIKIIYVVEAFAIYFIICETIIRNYLPVEQI